RLPARQRGSVVPMMAADPAGSTHLTPPPHPAHLTDPPSSPSRPSPPQLRRVLGFRDLLLYYVVTGFSLRWVAVAAAAGPSAIVIWVIAALGFFVPLVFSTLEVSSRNPRKGTTH